MRYARFLILALLFAPLACDDVSPSASGDLPVRLTAVLQSPNGDEGAVLIETRDPIVSVEELEGTLFVHREDDLTRVFIVLDTPGTIRFSVTLGAPAASIEWRILEVAGPDDGLRPDVSGYEVELIP